MPSWKLSNWGGTGGHRSSLDAEDWPNPATSVRSPRIGPGPVAGTEPWALLPSREAGARLEKRECIGSLRALSSEGAVRWSKRLHLRCKSRCRPSGYWRELGMDCSLFVLNADGCNLLPTATVPQYSLGSKDRNAPRRGGRTRPEECLRPTKVKRQAILALDQALATNVQK